MWFDVFKSSQDFQVEAFPQLLSCFVNFQVFDDWNKGELSSFLIEISRDIFKYKGDDGTHLLDKIRDAAGQVMTSISGCNDDGHAFNEIKYSLETG